MKKLLFILLACFISVSVVSLGNAQDACEGLEGATYGICNAYCNAHDCVAMEEATGESCAMLRKNWAKHTDVPYFPCDIVACGICAILDPATGRGTVGICEEIPAFECAEPLQNYGQNTCDVVTLPLPEAGGGCDEIPPGGMFGTFIPNCQFVGGIVTTFVCEGFLNGVQLPEDEACPAPPFCTDEQLENLNMPR